MAAPESEQRRQSLCGNLIRAVIPSEARSDFGSDWDRTIGPQKSGNLALNVFKALRDSSSPRSDGGSPENHPPDRCRGALACRYVSMARGFSCARVGHRPMVTPRNDRLIEFSRRLVGRVVVFRAMRCPICHQEVSWTGNPFRPFCSERCKLIDLDCWLSERYRVSTPLESRSQGSPAEENERADKRGSGEGTP